MNISTSELELLKPEILNGLPGISAWFTVKNADRVNPVGNIPGLNLGFNTASKPEQVVANRDLLFKKLGINPDWTAFADQVHGTRVRVVTAGGVYPETDALVTRVPGMAIGIQVADCGAVLLADPVGGVVAAVHAGWRGAVGGILDNALQTMVEEGSDPADIGGWISPCISRERFEVGEEVAELFPDRFVDGQNWDKPHLDLKGFLKQQMIDRGMREELIEVNDRCTIGESSAFYSWRREKDRSGRMMGIIRIDG